VKKEPSRQEQILSLYLRDRLLAAFDFFTVFLGCTSGSGSGSSSSSRTFGTRFRFAGTAAAGDFGEGEDALETRTGDFADSTTSVALTFFALEAVG
jgi:hypothetical protein